MRGCFPGPRRNLDGYAVEAIDGTQRFGKKSQAAIRPRHGPRPRGIPRAGGGGLVERQGRTPPWPLEHIVYSKWGEQVRPQAPKATISIGSISAV